MWFIKILAFFLIVAISSLLILNSITNGSLDSYKLTKPNMDVKEYFNGPLKAWGIIQDWRGNVVSRFDIKMIGKWEGDNGTLEEHFDYYNGKTQERKWEITKLQSGSYEGTASDIIGKAVGNSIGSATKWNYVMKITINDKTYQVSFDDWMWLMNDGVIINRSYLKKYGIKVAELTIFIQKQPIEPAPQLIQPSAPPMPIENMPSNIEDTDSDLIP